MAVQSRSVRSIVAIGASVMLSLSGAACGTDDSDSNTTAPTTVTVTAEASDTTAPVPTDGTPAPVTSDADTGPQGGSVTTTAGTTVTIPQRPNRDSPGLQSSTLFHAGRGEHFFVSPSGNVFCGIRNPNGPPPDIALGCQTRVSVAPAGGPTCANSPSNGYMVTIVGSKVHHDCTTQGIFTTEHPRVLQYGQSVWIYGAWCLSTRDGIACWAGDSPGFMISRDVNFAF